MAVYVDNANLRYGRMLMCHMVADSSKELLEMADLIGVQRKWLQNAGTYREHFDICLSKRGRAVTAGARELESRELVRLLFARRRKLEIRRDAA